MQRKQLDTLLTAAVTVLVVAVLGLGGYFGYTVYQDRVNNENSTPALRVIKVIRDQVRRSPNDPILRVRLGEALAAAGRAQQAIEQFNAALKIDPKHTGAYLDLGQLAMSEKRPIEAERYFNKVIELTDDSNMEGINQRRETAFYNLGLLNLQNKKYEEAIGSFKAALRIRNDASDTYYYLGRALYLDDEPDGAMQNLQYSLSFDPNFAQANYLAGRIYMDKGDKVNASWYFERASQNDPNATEPKAAIQKFGDPQKYVAQARKLQTTDFDAALTNAQIGCNLLPDDTAAWNLQRDIRVARVGVAKALKSFKNMATKDPQNTQIQRIVKELTAKLSKSNKTKKR